MKTSSQLADELTERLKDKDYVEKAQRQMVEKFESAKFDTQYFYDKNCLRMESLLREDNIETVLFRAAIDWGIIEPPKLVKEDENYTNEEFAKEQYNVKVSWSLNKKSTFEIGDLQEMLCNLLFILIKRGHHLEEEEYRQMLLRLTVVTLGRLELGLSGMLYRIGKLQDDKDKLSKLVEDSTGVNYDEVEKLRADNARLYYTLDDLKYKLS